MGYKKIAMLTLSVIFAFLVMINGVEAVFIWVNHETNYSSYENSYLCYVEHGVDEGYLTSAGGDDDCTLFWITEEYEELGENTTRIGWESINYVWRDNISESNDTYVLVEIYNYSSSSWNTICNTTFGGGDWLNRSDDWDCRFWYDDTHPEYYWSTNRRLRINTTGYTPNGYNAVMKYIEGLAGYNSSNGLFYCTSGDIALNFTAYDEETSDQLYFDMDILINYSVGASQFNYSYEYSGNNTYYVCYDDLIGQDVIINDAEIRYENNSYSTRYYYLENSTVDNVTDDVYLYLLANSSSTLITMRVLNQAESEEPGVIIQAQRYDIGAGTYTLVAESRSDFSGYSYTYLDLHETYRFVLIRDGTILREYDPLQLETTTLTFYIETIELPEYFDYYDQVATSCSFTNSTGILECSFADGSGLTSITYFNVSRLDPAGYTTLCNQSLTTTSGSFTCNLTQNATYLYSFYGRYNPQDSIQVWEQGYISFGSIIPNFGVVGLIMSFLIVSFTAFLSHYDIRASLIATAFGIVFCIGSGLLVVGVESLTMMITVALLVGIVAIKVK